MEEIIAAKRSLLAQMKPFRFKMHLGKADHLKVLNKFVLSCDFWVLLQIRIAVEDLIRLLEVLVDKFRCIQAENDEKRAKRLPLLLGLWLI